MAEESDTLLKFLTSLYDFEPTIPEALVQHYARGCGCEVQDQQLIRMIALAAKRCLFNVFQEALQVSRVRERLAATRLKDLGFNSKDKNRTLIMEELVKALRECGVVVPFVPYYLGPHERECD